MKGRGGWSRPVVRNRKRQRMAEGIAALAVAKVAQKRRSVAGRGGIGSVSVFQAPASNAPELKFIDVTSVLTITNGSNVAGPVTPLNLVARGIDATQEIGRKIVMKSLYWLWEGTIGPTSTGSTPVRLVILYDKEANGALPTVATGAQTDMFNQDNIYAQMNLNNRDRFIVLVDEIVECIGTAGPQCFYRKGYRKISLPVVFNATQTAAIGAINTGSIVAVQWGGGGLAVATGAANLQTRIRFEDA